LERLPRFPGVHEMGFEYNIKFTGPEPQNMRFEFQGVQAASDALKRWTIITIDYAKAANYWVYKHASTPKSSGARVMPNAFDNSIRQ
jgi:hypothetical protein